MSENRRLDNDVKESVEQAGGVFDRLEKQLDRERESSDVTWTVSRKVVVHRQERITFRTSALVAGLVLVGGAGGFLVSKVARVASVASDRFTEQSEPQLSPEAKRWLAAMGGGLGTHKVGAAFPGGGLTSDSDDSGPLFSFAPASGSGMTAPCACTTPSAASGQALTFTRSSTAWCTKANESTGIANGDLVECQVNEPRVMPGNDGTGGVGLAIWETRTNSTIRSSEFDDVTWLKLSAVVAIPVVTADAAIAPDGTMTADRVQFAATTALDASLLYQANACPSGTVALSLYVKGNGMSGTLDFGYNGAGEGISSIAYNSSTWTRFIREAGDTRVTPANMRIGNLSLLNGGVVRAANDVFLWIAQCESGSIVGPPISTAGTAVIRTAEGATFPLTIPAGGIKSMGATTTYMTGVTASKVAFQAKIDASNSASLTTTGSKNRFVTVIAGSTNNVDSAGSLVASASNAISGYYDGTDKGSCLAGVCATSTVALTLPSGSATLAVGSFVTFSTTQVSAVVKKVCLSNANATECR